MDRLLSGHGTYVASFYDKTHSHALKVREREDIDTEEDYMGENRGERAR